jgi:8-oxo-dGTP diphosphatase
VTDRREYPDAPLVGVGGVAIWEGRVLLIRRSKPPFEGQWSIPGGMLEVGETLREGVRRELLEETGIEVRVLDLVEVFERITRDESGNSKYHFVILDYLCEAKGGEIRAGSDAADAAWVRLSELGNYGVSEAATRVIEQAFELAHQGGAARKKPRANQ